MRSWVLCSLFFCLWLNSNPTRSWSLILTIKRKLGDGLVALTASYKSRRQSLINSIAYSRPLKAYHLWTEISVKWASGSVFLCFEILVFLAWEMCRHWASLASWEWNWSDQSLLWGGEQETMQVFQLTSFRNTRYWNIIRSLLNCIEPLQALKRKAFLTRISPALLGNSFWWLLSRLLLLDLSLA